MASRFALPPNQALQRTAAQPVELQASVRRRRPLSAGSLGGRLEELMRNSDFLTQIPATPAAVLAVLRDLHRHQLGVDPEAEPANLDRNVSIAEWRAAADLVRWRRLGRALNTRFGTSIPEARWRQLLEPADRRTLGPVCDALASQGQLPAMRPAVVAGRACLEAGVFLSLRTLLRRVGVPLEHVQPSAPLQPLLAQHGAALLDAAVLLAPGALPAAQLQHGRRHQLWMISLFASAAAVPLGALIQVPGLAVAGAVGLGLLIGLPWLGMPLSDQVLVLGELRTVRDLVSALVRGGERSAA